MRYHFVEIKGEEVANEILNGRFEERLLMDAISAGNDFIPLGDCDGKAYETMPPQRGMSMVLNVDSEDVQLLVIHVVLDSRKLGKPEAYVLLHDPITE